MKNLCRAIIWSACFLDLSDDDIVDPDSAVKALKIWLRYFSKQPMRRSKCLLRSVQKKQPIYRMIPDTREQRN